MASSRRKKRGSKKVAIISFVIHAGALAAIALISTGNVPAPIAIMMADVVPPTRTAPPPPPVAAETPTPAAAQPRPTRAPTPAPAAAETPQSGDANAPPDYGIAFEGLSNGGTGGIYVPQGDPSGVRHDGPTRVASRELAPAAADANPNGSHGCREEDEPARPARVRPQYTSEAIAARIEGRVRLSVSIDAEGRVVEASVISPLGHGLDEAALASIRSGHFEPAKHCGRAVASTFSMGVSFRL
jgi:protein TonB